MFILNEQRGIFMITHLSRFTLYAIIVYLASNTPILTVAAPQPSGENETHICGVFDYPLEKLHSRRFPIRRYARSFASILNAGEPRTVRLIYFTPNDWKYRADVVQKMKKDIHTAQSFFAEQMDAHGYGEATFRVEADSQGNPIVHHVNGKHPFSHYDNSLGSKVFSELQQTFDIHANIYFIVLGTDVLRRDNGVPAGGVGFNRGKIGGMALVPLDFDWGTVAHELGHAFGLGHDFRDGAHIMSYGPGWNRLSACSAEFLAVHPYFNPDIPIEKGEPPIIELVSPRRYPSGSRSIPVRLQVNDSDGVHQVLLSAQSALQSCRGLEGRRNSIAEFEYNGGFGFDGFTSLSESARHTILVHAVDTEGNVSNTSFTVAEQWEYHIDSLEGHTDAVRGISFSRGGILASGGWDRTVRLWDAAKRLNIATLEGHVNSVESIAFSPVGTLASGTVGAIWLWDIAAKQNIAAFRERTSYWVYGLSFSPDGKTLAAGTSDNTVELWNVETQQNFDTLPHTGVVFAVAFSHDGAILASGSEDGAVRLWDAANRKHIATLPHDDIVLSVAFTPDDRILVTGGRGDVELWDVPTKSSLAALPHGSTVSTVSFSTDGDTLASGGWDGIVKLWDVTTNENFVTFGRTSSIHSASFSPDGQTFATGTVEGTIELWDVSGLMELRLEMLAEVDIPDPYLRAAIAEALGKPRNAHIRRTNMANLILLRAINAGIFNLTGLEHATKLTHLFFRRNNISDISLAADLRNLTDLNLAENSVSDISALSELTNLRQLVLSGNSISDISAIAGLTNLAQVNLTNNSISDISPLTENSGLASGDEVYIRGNPLNYQSIHTHIPTLQNREVTVEFDNRTPQRIRIISGDDQLALPGTALGEPLAVEVRDEKGVVFEGVPVTFTVTTGNGILRTASAATDSNGRAESTLTLGPNPGTNIVAVSVTGIQGERTFNAEGIATPKTLEIISGNGQRGLPGARLEKPFVVEVRNQSGNPLPNANVSFSVTSGGGTPSVTNAATDSNGRAESTLTLGQNPGTNTVEVTVTGIEEMRKFIAEGILPVKRSMFTLTIPAGTHAIHIPLKVSQINGEDGTIETVGDLYNALGGAVNFIISYIGGQPVIYLGDQSAGGMTDTAIGGDTGLIVVMKNAATLEIGGVPLGTAGVSQIDIFPGNNLVGVPLDPAVDMIISDMLQVAGVTAIAVSKAAGDGFHRITAAGDEGDGPVEGGDGYVVVSTSAGRISIQGLAWENEGVPMTAPAVAFNRSLTPVLHVEGGVMGPFDMLSRIPELRVTVKNLSTGVSLDAVLGTGFPEAAYSGTFVELSRHAAMPGDVLEIAAHSPSPYVGARPMPQIVVSAEEVLTSRIKLPDLELYEIPSETELLANFPNPFNPETWIPYRLANAAEVTLEIYDAVGRLVRSIDVGFKPAAVYESRASAIYWDGRNDNGETVASGLYFYQLTTPSYSQLRRMVIVK